MIRPDQSVLIYPQVQQASFPLRLLSRAMSVLFQVAGETRGALYDAKILKPKVLPGRVISVGNIAVGGTGKTPTVIALCESLSAHGYRPAVLTRGYGSSIRKDQWVVLKDGIQVAGNCTPPQLPDEALLQSASLSGVPVVVGPRRYDAAQSWLAGLGADVVPTHWVLDDGFQHRMIKRDHDLVLLDGKNPLGNGCVLPWGMLREVPKALRRATHILITGGGLDQVSRDAISEAGATAKVFIATQESPPLAYDLSGAVTFDVTKHTPLLLVAGIARPGRVKDALIADGIPVNKELFPGDHAVLSPVVLANSAANMRSVVTTAKDYWRNPQVFRDVKIPVFVKNVRIVLPESLLTALR